MNLMDIDSHAGPLRENKKTEAMEVHHHPHIEKKNFKEYLLEGLMIFIAVTLGFFAESLREYFTNKEIERSNIESLVRNLEEDSLSLVETVRFNEMKSNWVDSFVTLRGSKLPDTVFQKQFIYYAIKLSAAQNFISNQTVFEQMKSSGTLRLIDRTGVVDSILKYESMYEAIKLQWEYVSKWDDKNQEQLVSSTDLTPLLANMDILNLNIHSGDLRADKLPKIKNDSARLQLFFNYEVAEKSSLMNYVYFLNKQLSYARTLITFLKKEYHIESIKR
jgi:hypothetical protein